MKDKKYEGINLDILKSKKSRIISSEEALKRCCTYRMVR